jgi:hypothetical protein
MNLNFVANSDSLTDSVTRSSGRPHTGAEESRSILRRVGGGRVAIEQIHGGDGKTVHTMRNIIDVVGVCYSLIP